MALRPSSRRRCVAFVLALAPGAVALSPYGSSLNRRVKLNDADRWRALAAVSGDLGRDIAMDLAACDAALMNAALEAEATYGGESREAAVQYALLEECRQRDARHRKDDDEGFPLSSAEAELELVERLNSSREYVSWLRQYRAERRRLSAASRIDASVATIPLQGLAAPWRSARAVDSAEAVAAATDSGDAVLWDIAEEILASDNSIAAAPSLEDDDSGAQPEDLTLSVELALEYIEQLSWRAEASGAFGRARAAI